MRVANSAPIVVLALLAGVPVSPSPIATPPAGELELALERLSVLGSVLYVAAHPDDEDTALLAYFSQERQLRTGYLSLTRGSGGQNLVGPERGDLLGVLRTEELLAARGIDGGEQFFTRAVDFGYTKSVDEALERWGREEILGDVVRVVRSFRPDVMITRFPGDGRGGHGQHTASAVLALEAFTAAGDPARFPEQLEELGTWQPTRLFWDPQLSGVLPPIPGRPQVTPDTKVFGWGPEQETVPPVRIELGRSLPLLGRSALEIAAASRSMHRTQGFGARAEPGVAFHDLALRAGPPADGNVLDGVVTTWERFPGGGAVEGMLEAARAAFRPGQPWLAVPHLLAARWAMDRLAPDRLVERKRVELEEVLVGALGLRIDLLGDRPRVAAGEAFPVGLRAVLGAPVEVRLTGLDLPFGQTIELGETLEPGRPFRREWSIDVPREAPPTEPHWLAEMRSGDRYTVGDPAAAVGPRMHGPLRGTVRFAIAGEEIRLGVPVRYEWTDPVVGGRRREVAVVPRVGVAVEPSVVVAPSGVERTVEVLLTTAVPGVCGRLELEVPGGWSAEPQASEICLDETVRRRVTLRPGPGAALGPLTAAFRERGFEGATGRHARTPVELDPGYFPPRPALVPAVSRLVPVELARGGEEIGYVMGAGDEVPSALLAAGYRVSLLDDEALLAGDLGRFDAIVTGIRAWNTRDALAAARPRLLAWAENGGTLVVQYNVLDPLVSDEIGPWPMTIGRARVTREEAPVERVLPEHRLLTTPNAIGGEEFGGWVQERGLYFVAERDERYEAPLALADPGEALEDGALLYTRVGDGAFVYTSLSFFRQLPAGVPGAYRLFANLLAAGES